MKKTLIFVSGKKRSGKGTVSQILFDLLENSTKLSFAEILKKNAKEDFKLLIEDLNEIFEKHNLKQYLTKDEHWGDGEKSIVSRRILQIYGTNIFRNRVSKNYWIEQVEQKVLNLNKEYFIFTDVRFPNEIEYFEKKKIYKIFKIRVKRYGLENKDEHYSEKAFDNYNKWNYVIKNNSSLDDLKSRVSCVINKFLKSS